MGESDPRRDKVVRELIRHRSNLFAFILSIVRKFDVAEEVMQEVSVVVCAQWADFKPGSNFGAWAAQIARNKIFNLNRASRRQVLLNEKSIEEVLRATEEETPTGWVEAVKNCLELASEKVRSLLTMRYQDDLSGAEIARQLKTSVTAVHMSLSRARTALGECIEGRLE